MTTVPVSFSAISPEIVLIAAASVLLTFGVFVNHELARRLGAIVAAGALVGAGIAAGILYTDHAHYAFDHTVRIDAFGQLVRLIVFAAALVSVGTSWGMGRIQDRALEYWALLLVACSGMSLLAVSNSFVTLFVSLELFSIALYVLVAIRAEEERDLEGSLKYLIVGSLGAAFLLYGSALVYGATGALEFDRVRAAIGHDTSSPLLLLGIAMLLAGLGFKANAAPMHMWTPDAYQ